MMPVISVITATFNAAATLEAMILSVINQTYQSVELIIIDGGSTDDTISLIEKYKTRISYWVSEKDEGIYDALNKGIKVANGDWVYILGSDDTLITPSVLNDLFSARNIEGIQFLYGNTRLKSNNKLLGGSRTYEQLIEKNISHQAIFYHKTLFTTMGFFDLRYKILSDYDYNLKVFAHSEIKTSYVDVDICLFNDKGGASNVTIDGCFFSDKLRHFVNVDNFSPTDGALQQYNFYHGVTLLLQKKKISGLIYCFRSFFNGRRKIFYMLVFIKFMIGALGIGKKIKFS